MADTYQTFPASGGGGGGIPDDGSVTDIKVAVGANINAAKLGTGIVSTTEFNTLDGVTSSIQTQLNAKEATANKGIAGGYASLDGSGKVPLSQISDSILGQVSYQGTWDASTNTPTLSGNPASTTLGDYYVVSVAGTQFSISFAVGDWIISNGSAWEKVDNTDAVTTVFGRNGNILAVAGDYTASQITNVPAGSIAATDVQAAINELDADVQLKADAANPVFTGTVDFPTGTGILHSDSGGVISSSLIDNVDVSASAAIAGTKISPDFGSQAVTTTGAISGVTLATTGTAGAGFVNLNVQSASPAAPATNNVRLWSDATGRLAWRQATGGVVTIVAPSANQTYTLPASTSTFAVLGLAQTFSALQTFSAGITASGSVATTVSSTGGIVVSATGGSGRVQLNAQASAPTGTASNCSVYSDASGNLSFKAGTTAGATFTASGNTAVRAYTLPDLAGTFAISGSSQNWSTTGTLSSGALTVTAGANALLGQSGLNSGTGFAVEGANGTTYFRSSNTGTAVTSALFYGGGINAGEIRINTSALTIAFANASDYRIKTNIADAARILDKFEKLQPRSYEMKRDGYKVNVGFIAHELQEVFPEAVVGEKDGEEIQKVTYGELIPHLMAAVKELHGVVKSLQAEVESLKGVS